MSLAFQEQVVTTLQSLGFGTLGVNLFAGQLPSTPFENLAAVVTGGYHDSANPVNKPSLQILYRSVTYRTGFSKVNSIDSALGDKFNIFGCSYPGRFRRMSYAGFYYKDDNGHYVFPLNYVFETLKKQ